MGKMGKWENGKMGITKILTVGFFCFAGINHISNQVFIGNCLVYHHLSYQFRLIIDRHSLFL
jgi:hypothetical protein